MFKMLKRGYRQKFLIDGNDGRGIEVAVMAREETADGQKIEFVNMQSHAQLTYAKAGLHNPALQEMGEEAHEKTSRWYRKQQDKPVADVERDPHQEPEGHEREHRNQDLEDATGSIWFAVAGEDLCPFA